jgi:hypothetical protein
VHLNLTGADDGNFTILKEYRPVGVLRQGVLIAGDERFPFTDANDQ